MVTPSLTTNDVAYARNPLLPVCGVGLPGRWLGHRQRQAALHLAPTTRPTTLSPRPATPAYDRAGRFTRSCRTRPRCPAIPSFPDGGRMARIRPLLRAICDARHRARGYVEYAA